MAGGCYITVLVGLNSPSLSIPFQYFQKRSQISQFHEYLLSQLVGGFNHLEKYEFVSWDDDIPNIWKVIAFMFQTTNQPYHHIPIVVGL